jgi:hypothetical protein
MAGKTSLALPALAAQQKDVKLGMAIREAHRQWRRPRMIVYCPYEQAQAITARSRRGPMCSGCGARIDLAPCHSLIKAYSPSR